MNTTITSSCINQPINRRKQLTCLSNSQQVLENWMFSLSKEPVQALGIGSEASLNLLSLW